MCLVLFWSACAVPVCPVPVPVPVPVLLVLVWAGCCPWLGGVGAPAGCERVSSAAADGGADLWWRPCCGAACLSLLCLAWLGLVWSVSLAVRGSRYRSVRVGRAGGGGLLAVGPAVVGSGGVSRRRGPVAGRRGVVVRCPGVWGWVPAGSPVCFCAGAGVWPGVWSGGDWAAVSGWVGLGRGADR